jgi:menaquinone-specific isochorismate synthase
MEYDIKAMDIFDIFANYESKQKFYWQDREKKFEYLGFLNLYDSDIQISKLLGAEIRFIYASKFNPDSEISEKWADFGQEYYFLPRFSFERFLNNYKFVCNIDKNDLELYKTNSDEFFKVFEINELLEQSTEFYIKDFSHTPNRKTWKANINKALEVFANGEAEKIALSRITEIKFENPITPERFFQKLIKDKSESYYFYMQINPNSVFMGVSPELLFSVKDGMAAADALAGTAARGENTSEDEKLANDLLSDAKEIEEHKIVVDFIAERLSSISEFVNKPDRVQIKILSSVQHLYTPINSKLIQGVDFRDILNAINPTPAVCGIPQDKAFDLIEELEQFDRGYYAGAIGHVKGLDSEFAVGIRSALYNSGKLYIYSGAGIVQGSNPDLEWVEIENKMKNFSGIFSDD